jgi:hypothetical protein
MDSYYAVSPFEVATLQTQLRAAISQNNGGDHWLALVDSAFDHGRKTLPWPTTTWPVYYQGKLASMQPVSPILLTLPSEHEPEFEKFISRLLHHCNGRPMLSFLHSTKPPGALREFWQSALEIKTEGGQPFLLRFADTRTLPGIAATLATDAWPRLRHGIEQWLYVDRDGNLEALPLAEQASTIGGAQETARINNEELAQLLRLAQPDALADAFQEHFPDLLMPQSQGAMMYKQLHATCTLADKHGIDAFPDLLALAVSVRLSEGRLLEDVDFASWLKQRHWVSQGLANALSDYLETGTTLSS